MLKKYFDAMVTGVEAKLLADPGNPHARKRFALALARLGQNLYSDKNRIAWCGVAVPFDLLQAMGVTSCYVEFIGAMLSVTGTVTPLLEVAEHRGYSSDACGYHRAVMGAAEQGIMPIPDFLIGTTCPCSGGLATIENLARLFKKDLFILHIPQEQSATSVRYLADQYKDMVKFVSAHTGEPLNQKKFCDVIEKTNKVRALMEEIYQFVSHVPSPASGRDLGNFGITMALLLGTQEAIDVATSFRDEFKNRIEAKISGVPGERVRLMWIQNRLQFVNPIIKWLEERFQASVIVDELNTVTWNPVDMNDPYASLAQRAISIPFNGNIEHRVAHLKKQVLDNKIDGAINPCHWGCRQGTGARGMIEESLKEIGVPVLNLEVDCIDERNFAEGQLKTRIEAFMEMIGK